MRGCPVADVTFRTARKGRPAMRQAGETLPLQGVDRGPSARVRQQAGDRAEAVACWGTLRGGRAVAIEVKSCSNGRLDLDRLPPHQRAELEAVEQIGGLALVLVVVGGVAHAVPWAAVRAAIEAGARSLGVAEVEVYRCPPGRPYLQQFLGEPCA